MALIKSAISYFSWHNSIIVEFLRVQFRSTFIVIAATVLARVAQLIAFFLPLKVVLLAGSDGVPHYFQGFMSPGDQYVWILGLSLLAVVAYVVSIALESMADRYAGTASNRILGTSTIVPVLNNQERLARSYFRGFCKVAASLAFSCVLLAGGLLLYPTLFIFVVVLIAIEFVITSLCFSGHDLRARFCLGYYIINHTGNYLYILSSSNFLAVFGFLLSAFLLDDGPNVLIAILSILISRQLFVTLTQVIRNARDLSADHSRINALVFTEHRFFRPERSENQLLREHFRIDRRVARTGAIAANKGIRRIDRIESHWVDSDTPGIWNFEVSLKDAEDRELTRWLEKVYSETRRLFFENESLLFRHMTEGELRSAPVIDEYEVASFSCRVYDYGNGKTVRKACWPKAYLALLAYYWRLGVSPELAGVYARSKPLLHERIGSNLIQRIDVAVESSEENRVVEHLLEQVPKIRSFLKKLPLFIFNPDLRVSNVVLSEDGDFLVTSWGRWTLEPIGVGLPNDSCSRDFKTGVSNDLELEGFSLQEIDESNLALAAATWQFEQFVQRNRYRSALRLAEDMTSLVSKLSG